MRFAFVLLALLADVAAAATFTVDTTSDVGLTACTDAAANDCSLRGALTRANGTAVEHLVQFNIPMTDGGCVAATGVCTIRPATALPDINPNADGLVTIDGLTQPGASANTNTPAQGGSNAQLKIVLSGTACGGGSGCSNGLSFVRHGTVSGLVINGFGGGTAVSFSQAGNGGVVEGCYIGTDVTGTIAVPNSLGVIAGGNPFGGGFSSNVRVGGNVPAKRNVISGQTSDGINAGGANFQILGNLIGTNAAGTAALGNATGIRLSGGNGFFQIVGGADTASRNVISGNGRGVVIAGAGPTNGTRVIGNFIGTDVTGTLPLGNGNLGIELSTGVNGVQPPMVGGTLAGEGNVFAFNGTQGVATRNTQGQVIANRIYRNGQLGISGRTGDNGTSSQRIPNDPGDPDNPANNGQNFPDISAYAVSGGNVNLSYRVDSTTANSAYPLRVEFFKADGDEGRDLIGFDNYLAVEAQTVKAISLPIPPGLTLGADDVIVGTATDAQGNTSEFSFSLVQSLAIIDDTPDPSIAGLPYSVTVRAESTGTPFKPNGSVVISDGRGSTCVAALAPTVTANRSEGSCELVSAGAAGGFFLTASYSTFASAFGTSIGASIADASAPHQIGAGAVAIEAADGGNQYTRVSTPFAMPLRVRVLAAGGAPFAGASVRFAAPTGGASASLSATTAVSDANGIAEVLATANAVAGRYSITASLGGLTQGITLNNDSLLGSRCTGARISVLGFRDDFAGSAIDPARWTVDANDGSVTVAAGEATVSAGNVVGFPYVTASAGPLPPSGAFSLRWIATYTSTSAVYGNNSLVASTGLAPDGGPAGSVIFHAYAGQYPDGYRADALISASDPGPPAFISNPPALVRREVEFCWLQGRDELWVDGVRVENPVRDPTLARPDALWFGNFDRGVLPGEHPDFRLDLVEVRALEVGFSTDLRILGNAPNPAGAGQSVTVTAAVNPEPGAPTAPTGVVSVQASTGETCTITLPAASCALAFASVGERVIEAFYNGDSVFRASKSARVDQQVLPPATLAISDATLAEGNSGNTAFTFTVSLANASGAPVTVQYATANDSASAPGDFASTSGVLSFSGTTTSLPMTVDVIGDATPEPNEQFFVNLGNPTGATLADGQGVGTINNDDAPAPVPQLRVLDAGLVREPSGSAVFAIVSFVLELDRAPTEAVSVTVETRDGTALAGSDYARQSPQVVTFDVGQTRAVATVRISRDPLLEPAENFFVDADTPVGLTIADASGEAIIVAGGTPLVVNTTADTTDGLCSPSADGCTLREAITNANTNIAISRIDFAIPGTQTQVIRPTSPLPPLNRLLTIDGYTQPGAVPNSADLDSALDGVIRIEIDGSTVGVGNGIKLCAGGTVRGLAIHGFVEAGISADCGVSNQPITLEGSYLGLKADGITPSGNGIGVRVEPTDDGRPETQFSSGELVIGDGSPATRNLIAANRIAGIVASPRQQSVTTRIRGNLIGTDRSGTVPLGNGIGVLITQPHPRCIASLDVHDNVIAGSTGDGLRIASASPPLLPDTCTVQAPVPMVIQSNLIGVGLAETPLANGGAALRVSHVVARPPGFGGASDGATLVGSSTSPALENTFFHANGGTIVIDGEATRFPISGNRTLSNQQLIDLGGDGTTFNDPGDPDVGPNTLLNTPVPNSAVVDLSAGVVRVNYSLDASFTGGDGASVYVYRFGDEQRLVAVDRSVQAGSNDIDLRLGAGLDAGDLLALSLFSPTLGSSELSAPRFVSGAVPALTSVNGLENSGQPLRATLSLSPAPSAPVSFDVRTRNGSARAGIDYTSLATTVTLTPTQPSAAIDVALLNDSDVEFPETLTIEVSPGNLGQGVAGTRIEAVIDDDDLRALDQNLYDTLRLSDLNGQNGVTLFSAGNTVDADLRIVGSGNFVGGPEPDLVVASSKTHLAPTGGVGGASRLFVVAGSSVPLPASIALQGSPRSVPITSTNRTLSISMARVRGGTGEHLIVGEPDASAGRGSVTIVNAGLPLSGLTATLAALPGSRIAGANNDSESPRVGVLVNALGDFNDDTFADFVANGYANAGSGTPTANIVYGRAGGFPTNFAANLTQGGARLLGLPSFAQVRGIGDFNGDGRADLAIFGVGSNCASVVPGRAAGVVGRITLAAIPGVIRVCAAFQSNGLTSQDRRVLAGGDVNGDGFSDLVFGDLARDGSRSRAYIVHGRDAPPATINVVPGVQSSVVTGEWAGDGFSSIDVLPDFDGDGRSDVAFGMKGNDQLGVGSGNVFVLYGAPNLPAQIDLNAATPVLGKRIEGPRGSRSGFEVRALADFNGDGLGDLGITAPGSLQAHVVYSSDRLMGTAFEAQPSPRTGPARFDLGRTVGTPWATTAVRPVRTVGDLNADGRLDLVSDSYCVDSICTRRAQTVVIGAAALTATTSEMNGRNGFVVTGNNDVRSGGDFDGDGRGELLIRGIGARSAVLQYGRTIGFFAFPSTVSPGGAQNPPRTSGTTELRFQGASAILREVRAIGDFGGGAQGDLLVTWCPNGCTFGALNRARIVFGRADRPSTIVVDALPAGQFVELTSASGVFFASMGEAALGDFGGDSKADLVLRVLDDGVADRRVALLFGGASLPASIDPLTTSQGFRVTAAPSEATVHAMGRLLGGTKDDLAFMRSAAEVQIYRGRSAAPGDNLPLFDGANVALLGPRIFASCSNSGDTPTVGGPESADLDADGVPELLLPSRGEGRATSAGTAPWLRGLGSQWENRQYVVCGGEPGTLLATGESRQAELIPIGDWDGDGKVDFVDRIGGLIYRGSQVPAIP
jgi:CSLREA domain-containing protein